MKSPLTLVLSIILGFCIFQGINANAQETIPENAKLPSSPNQVWDVLFNHPIVSQVWGVECDGSYLYGTYPYDTGFAFCKYDYSGTLIENFNIPGVPKYGPPNYLSPRNMCYDGQYWWVIAYGNPSKLHKINPTAQNLVEN